MINFQQICSQVLNIANTLHSTDWQPESSPTREMEQRPLKGEKTINKTLNIKATILCRQ